MKSSILRLVPWLAATLLLVVAWAVVLWVALEVSTIVLETLHAIVDLAQMGP